MYRIMFLPGHLHTSIPTVTFLTRTLHWFPFTTPLSMSPPWPDVWLASATPASDSVFMLRPQRTQNICRFPAPRPGSCSAKNAPSLGGSCSYLRLNVNVTSSWQLSQISPHLGLIPPSLCLHNLLHMSVVALTTVSYAPWLLGVRSHFVHDRNSTSGE